MLDLSKRILPNTITLDNGKSYKIKTDFRLWLRMESVIKNNSVLNDFDFYYQYNGLKPPILLEEKEEGLKKLIEFWNPPSLLPRNTGSDNNSEKTFSFTQDSDFIYSAFLEQYNIDLLTVDLHWWQFLALFRGLHDTKLNEIIGYRSWTDGDNKDLEQIHRELRESWRLEEEPSEEELEEQKKVNEFFS